MHAVPNLAKRFARKDPYDFEPLRNKVQQCVELFLLFLIRLRSHLFNSGSNRNQCQVDYLWSPQARPQFWQALSPPLG